MSIKQHTSPSIEFDPAKVSTLACHRCGQVLGTKVPLKIVSRPGAKQMVVQCAYPCGSVEE